MSNLNTHPYETINGYLWAAINRAAYFAFVAVGGAAMRDQSDQTLERLAAVTHARELEQEIVRAGEREQVRIGQDLHDGICQNLAAIDCAAECLREELEAAESPHAAAAAQIQHFLKETIVEARNLARGIFPVQVEEDGLVSALDELVKRTSGARGIQVTLEAEHQAAPASVEVAMHLYRITQESLANAVRHAGAKEVWISLKSEDGTICLSIRDDGKGFPVTDTVTFGIGIRAMQHRAQLVGGELEIRSRPDIGTNVICRLPGSGTATRHTEALIEA